MITGCVPGTTIGNFLITVEKSKSFREIVRTSSNLQSISETNDSASSSTSSPALSKSKSRRVSARDFFDDVNVALTNFEALDSQTNTWEMVLASGISGDIEKMDVVFVGHEDG